MGIVTLHAGTDARPVYVHKDALVKSCAFSDKALRTEFKEGHDQVMKLSEEFVDEFDVFVQWL